LQTGTDLLPVMTSTADKLSRGYQHRRRKTALNLK